MPYLVTGVNDMINLMAGYSLLSLLRIRSVRQSQHGAAEIGETCKDQCGDMWIPVTRQANDDPFTVLKC